jgi:hypothetical protein
VQLCISFSSFILKLLDGFSTEFLGEKWNNQGLALSLSAKTYIENAILKFEGLTVQKFKAIKTAMSEGYHPDVDDSPLCIKHDSAKYRSIIGCCVWIIILGIFDKAYFNSTMIRINMLPMNVFNTLTHLRFRIISSECRSNTAFSNKI